ncbi:MAG: ArsA-related P-loop ATPase [Myxococcota bacterium]
MDAAHGPSPDTPQEITKLLLGSQLVLVTGKGGTGKTTFATALARVAAAQGRRVLLAEIDSQRPSLTPIFGIEPGFEPVGVNDNLDVANLTWQEALQHFLTGLVPSRRIVKLILSNRLVGRFLDFTPGSREIVTLSALGDLVSRYDLVVADLPASGHAFSLMDITRSALGLFRSGPVRARAQELRELIAAETTRTVLVALPEEMVVNETIETYQKLKRYEHISGPPVVFLNRATLPTLTDAERDLLGRLQQTELSPDQREFVRAGHWEDELEQATEESQARLAGAIPRPPLLVPPMMAGGTLRDVVAGVAAHLGRWVGVSKRELSWR